MDGRRLAYVTIDGTDFRVKEQYPFTPGFQRSSVDQACSMKLVSPLTPAGLYG